MGNPQKLSEEKTFIVIKDDDNTEIGRFDHLNDAILEAEKQPEETKITVLQTKDFDIGKDSGVATVNRTFITLKSSDNQQKKITINKWKNVLYVNSKLMVENIVIDGNKQGSAFSVMPNEDQKGILTLNNCVIQNCKNDDPNTFYHVAIFVSGNGKLILNNTTIKNNVNATKYDRTKFNGVQSIGSGIYATDNATLTINDSYFENNITEKYGGAICSGSDCTVNLKNVTFKNNLADSIGGAIFAYGSLSIESCFFEENKASSGGAIGVMKNVEIKETSFTRNVAQYGGAIIEYGGELVIKENSTFESNEATKQGGAIYNSGKLNVESSNFSNNFAESGGGAIFIKDNNSNENKVLNSTFTENSSKFGGGIYVNVNSKLDVEKSNFKKNEAAYGAGISSAVSGDVKDCKIKIAFSTFEENKAFLGAGVFTAFPTEISSAKFIKNYADVHSQDDQKNPHESGCGGALYVMDNKTTITSSKFIENGAYGSGGAISINGVNRDKDGKITSLKANISVDISNSTKFEKNEVKVGQGGAIYTIPYEYKYEIKDNKAYKNLNIDETTLFLNNKSAEGLFVPPKNYKDFTNLKFSNKSDVKHEILQVESLLNNYDINYKNEMRIITYDANGGKFSDGKTIKSYEYEINKVIKIIEAPTREGYKFLYWKGSVYKPNDDYKVIDHHKFIAQWEKKEEPKPEPIPKIEFKEHEYTKTYPVVAKLPEKAQTHIEYLSGYPDLMVKADGNIKRAEAVTMLVRLKGYQIPLQNDNKQIYKDVLKNSWYRPFIEVAFKEGILEEKEGENFRPDENMTRGELAKLISHVDAKNSEKTSFTDIEGYKYKDAIEQAFANKRITGYPDNTFRPDKEITRAETVTILNKLFDRMVRERGLKDVRIAKFIDLDKNHWAYYEIIEASHTHEYERIEGAGIEEKWLKIIK